MSNVMTDEEELRQFFRNHSNCYADTNKYIGDGKFEEGEVVQAIDEDRFIELVTEARKGMFTADEVIDCADVIDTNLSRKENKERLEQYLTERKGR